MAQGDVLGFIKNRPGNLLINGLTEIRQRSAIGLAMDATFAYRVQDRFVTKVNNTGDFNTRIQSNTILTDTKGVVQEAMNIATNAVNVNAKVFIQQMIESLNAQALANKKASFSFEFLNRGFTDVTVNVYYPTVIDDHTVQTLIDSKSETFAIDAVTKKFKFENISIPVEAKNGLAIEIVIDGIIIAADWDNPLSKFMFNEGPVVAEFERAGSAITGELLLCQRYYERLDVGEHGQAGTNGIVKHNGHFYVLMRITPVMVFTGDISTATISDEGWQVSEGGKVANQGIFYTWTADAEL